MGLQRVRHDWATNTLKQNRIKAQVLEGSVLSRAAGSDCPRKTRTQPVLRNSRSVASMCPTRGDTHKGSTSRQSWYGKAEAWHKGPPGLWATQTEGLERDRMEKHKIYTCRIMYMRIGWLWSLCYLFIGKHWKIFKMWVTWSNLYFTRSFWMQWKKEIRKSKRIELIRRNDGDSD